MFFSPTDLRQQSSLSNEGVSCINSWAYYNVCSQVLISLYLLAPGETALGSPPNPVQPSPARLASSREIPQVRSVVLSYLPLRVWRLKARELHVYLGATRRVPSSSLVYGHSLVKMDSAYLLVYWRKVEEVLRVIHRDIN